MQLRDEAITKGREMDDIVGDDAEFNGDSVSGVVGCMALEGSGEQGRQVWVVHWRWVPVGRRSKMVGSGWWRHLLGRWEDIRDKG